MKYLKLYESFINESISKKKLILFSGPSASGKTYLATDDKSALAKKYDIFKGVDWPSKEDFLNDNLNQVSINVFQEISALFRKDKIRTDDHPTPLEHLDYINKVMPEINILDHTLDWIKQADEAVLTNKEFLWDRHLPSRL
jgi:hypothetical protein